MIKVDFVLFLASLFSDPNPKFAVVGVLSSEMAKLRPFLNVDGGNLKYNKKKRPK